MAKVYGIFFRDGRRAVVGLLHGRDADLLVDKLRSLPGYDDYDFHNEEESWDGTVAIICLRTAIEEWNEHEVPERLLKYP